MTLTSTQLFASGIVPLTQDLDIYTGGVPISAVGNWKVLRLVIGLSGADKLAAVGAKTVSIWSHFSQDAGATWKFINRTDWQSYGPGGLTFPDPDGTVWVNRDPTLDVPLNGLAGLMIRAGYHAHLITQSTGIVIYGMK
jgi:hypothetical protein